jgi:CheY-like chemotaxis protein
LEVLSQLKSDPATRNIPVMIVTGYREAAEEALERGAVSYFLKPFRIPDILEKVRQHLKIPPLAKK